MSFKQGVGPSALLLPAVIFLSIKVLHNKGDLKLGFTTNSCLGQIANRFYFGFKAQTGTI